MNNSEKVTVQLVVAADGALRALDQFDSKMTDAANASAKAGAAQRAFHQQLARMRSAMESGMPALKARAAALSYEEKILQSTLGKADAVYRAKMAAERDFARASAAASNLVIQGKMREEEALRQLAAIESAHTAQVERAIGLTGQQAVANDNLAESYRRVGTAQHGAGSGFQTSNIAMQFQDVAVTSAMGMSPMMIALQQGTQLQAALGGQGLRGTVTALGAAFGSLLSPISLATMAAVGLGAAGIQALMQLTSGAEDATEALADHATWLNDILEGYDKAQAAVAGFIETATTKPTGALQSDLETQRVEALKQVSGILDEIARKESEISTDLAQMALMPMIHQDALRTAAGLDALGISASSTDGELDALEVRLTRLANDSGAADQARGYARDLLGLIDRLQASRTQVDSLGVALNNLPTDISIGIRLNGLQGVADAVAQLQGMTPDLRTDRQVADDIFSQNIGQARTISEIDALVEAHGRLNAALDEQDRIAKAAQASAGAASSGDAFGGNLDSMQQRIDALHMEMALMGQSTYEIERQRAAFELLNQAKAAGVPITADLNNQINAMADEYADATMQLQKMSEAQQRTQEIYDFGKQVFTGFFGDIRKGIQEGKDLWTSLADAASNALDRIADKLMEQALSGLWDILWNAGMSAIGGGIGSIGIGSGMPGVSSITGIGGGYFPGFADGTNFAPGGMTWVGERGPELLRLPRGAEVFPANRSSAMAAANDNSSTVALTMHNTIQVPPGATAETGAQFATAFTRELDRQLPGALRKVNRNPLRRVG